MIELSSKAKPPKRRKTAPAIPPHVAGAMRDYSLAYFGVYKRKPELIYLQGLIRIDGAETGVYCKRIKELTRQLRERARDMQ